ncbi:single-strand-selective monofunctional uracil-DNA glycosylase 1 [Lampris incognitus]|uniref:single-strand-selective monofunctional uracil-DNA glycosylase 1 n=1 Tax=Lampris incognitus TaxID=2546036 RepID=UPI0024B522D4|nr:single-strand-selective monofunctional uracil-DNA glycosylase 1 [Lampris incognitus]
MAPLILSSRASAAESIPESTPDIQSNANPVAIGRERENLCPLAVVSEFWTVPGHTCEVPHHSTRVQHSSGALLDSEGVSGAFKYRSPVPSMLGCPTPSMSEETPPDNQETGPTPAGSIPEPAGWVTETGPTPAGWVPEPAGWVPETGPTPAGRVPEPAGWVPETGPTSAQFLQAELELNAHLRRLTFGEPVRYIYNPLEYAWDTHRCYVETYCHGGQSVLFLGMNPGPFGMAQTGVPFGEVSSVRDWLKITGEVSHPAEEHPKRPITGLACSRREVSGARFWGFFRKLCGEPALFFRHCFVHNLCPLIFMSATGKNLTPPDLPAGLREKLLALCDVALCQAVKTLGVSMVIGVGKVAEHRARRALSEANINVRVEGIMHPSPRNPQANKGWQEVAEAKLTELGVLELLRKT